MYRVAIIAGVLASLAAMGFAAALWFMPFGAGEYCESPNGRNVAHVSNMEAGTLFEGRVDYVELKVVDSSTGRKIWRLTYKPPSAASVPDYSQRGARFINWSPNSTMVTFALSDSHSVDVPVP